MRRGVSAGLTAALAAAMLAHGGAAAEPAISETVKYYTVSGWDARDVRKDMDQRRPTDSSGIRRDAVTTWDAKWRLTLKSGAAGCGVDRVAVTASIVTTLPRLVRPRVPPYYSGSGGLSAEVLQRAEAALIAQFSEYLEKLTVHEKEHGRIGAETAAKIETALLALSPAADCAALRKTADAAAQALIREAAEQNEAYDLTTQNGATQGAIFP